MVRRSLRFVLHFAAGCLLVCGVIVIGECVLLNQETARRQRIDDPDGGSGVVLRSAKFHHSLRPAATTEHALADGGTNRVPLNSLGLRGPEPVIPKPANVYRVVMLGDETVFAPDLRESDTAAFQLKNLLQSATRHQVEVVNASVPGYCPLLSLLQFRHTLVGLHPDVIILHFDMSDVADDRRYRSTLQSDVNGLSLSCAHPALLGVPNKQAGTIGRFAIGRWLIGQLCDTRECTESAQRYTWLNPNSFGEWRASVNASLGPVAELSDMARQLSSRFILTATPVLPDRIDGLMPTVTVQQTWQNPSHVLTSFAQEQRIEFCQPFPVSPQSDELLSQHGLSRLGHQTLAIELAAQIRGLNPGSTEHRTPVQQVSAERPNRM